MASDNRIRYIPDLWLNWMGDAGISGTSPITAIADQSGNGNHAVIATTATLVSNQLNGKPVIRIPNNHSIRTPATPAAMVSGFSMFMVVKHAAGASELCWGNDTGSAWMGIVSTSPQGFGKGYLVTTNPNYQVSGGAGFYQASMVFGYPAGPANFGNATQYYSADGFCTHASGVTNAITSGNAIEIPRQGYGSHDLAELIIFNRPLSRTEIAEVQSYLAGKYNLWWPGNDSGTLAFYASGNSTTQYSGGVVRHLATQSGYKLITDQFAADGTNGALTFQLGDTYESVASYWRRRSIPSALVYHSGHDRSTDIDQDAITRPDGPLMRWAKAGGRLWLQTQTAWHNSAGRETARAAWNAWIRAHAATYADAFHDLGASAQFGAYDSVAGWNGTTVTAPAGTSRGDYPTYWAGYGGGGDDVHPTAAGQAAKAAMMLPYLSALYNRIAYSGAGNAVGSVTLTHGHAAAGWAYEWHRGTASYDPLDRPGTRNNTTVVGTSQTITDTTTSLNTSYVYFCKLIDTNTPTGWVWSDPFPVKTLGMGPSADLGTGGYDS